MFKRIAFIIPLMLVLLSVSSSIIIFWQTNRNEAAAIHEHALVQLKLDVTRLKNILYNLVTEETLDLESMRLNVSVTAMNDEISSIILTDENFKVMIANRYNWENFYARDVSSFDQKIADVIKKENTSKVIFSGVNNELLTGYYPVVVDLESDGGLPVKKLGVLYVEYSMANKLQHARIAAINHSMLIAGVLILTTIFVAFFMHNLVSRRLNHLRLVASSMTSGNLDMKSGLSGNDEISQLGMAFDEMVERIKNDIGRREEAENNLHTLNGVLEERIEERTQQLEVKTRELLDAQAVAHHTNKLAAMGVMASGLAHEINSPLQAIMLLTYKLRKMDVTTDEKMPKEVASKIEEIVKTISNTIESLRRMSRNSSNDPYDRVDLKKIVDNVTGLTRDRYIVNDVVLSVSYRDDCENVKINCQPTEIGQVLINLLNNAYDEVLEQDEKWISLEVIDTEDEVKFIVTDSGVGVSKEEADLIFEPMYTTKDIGEGTGLGLSISAQIALQHNGTLILDQSSKNTSFILTLPKKQ